MRIAQTHTVIEYKLADNLVLLIGGALKEYQKNTNAQVRFLNIPQNMPPDAPRIMISSQNSIINISLTRFEIIAKIPDHIMNNSESTIEFSRKNIQEILSMLWVPELKYNWLGLVSTLEYPLGSGNNKSIELAIPFFDKLINIDRKDRSLGTFEMRFGFNEGNFFKNYNISCFETRDIKIDSEKFPAWQNIINIEDVSQIKNSGLRVIFDINNKPKENRKDPITDLDELIIDFKKTINLIPVELNIKDLI